MDPLVYGDHITLLDVLAGFGWLFGACLTALALALAGLKLFDR